MVSGLRMVVLLLNAGQRLSRDAAIEAVWAGTPPSTARAQVHNAIRDIRGRLAEFGEHDLIVTEWQGYRAAFGPEPAAALDELQAGHLLWRKPTGRYQMHALMRLYAGELDADPQWRHAAERRLLLWYATEADRADAVLRPQRGDLYTGLTGTTAYADATAALAWFDAEAANLVPAVAAAQQRHPDVAWRLAAVLFGWLERRQSSDTLLSVYEMGLRAAEADGAWSVAAAYNNLGWAYRQAGRIEDAVRAYTPSVKTAHDGADAQGVAYGESNIGLALADRGEYAEAVDHWQAGVEYARRAGDLRLEASARVGGGRALERLGRVEAARAELTAVLDVYRDLGEGDTAEVRGLLAELAEAQGAR